jgi:hypothetical protein
MNFAQWQRACAPGEFRFFSLGRHALVEALRAAGVKAGDKVLLPEFICRDVMASLRTLEAEAVWYPVGENLHPACPAETWTEAKVVLAINYFGFPQPLEPFRAYAARTGAILIEDNAQGFLSRDEAGTWLGTRCDAGIFSLRKSLPIADGAALVVANGKMTQALAEPVVPTGRGYTPRVVWKAKLRAIPGAGIMATNALTASARFVRWLRSGHAIPPSDETAECSIPYPLAAHRGLLANLAPLDMQKEIGRRRSLYRQAEAAALSLGILPLFPALPPQVSPYGFPFRTNCETKLKQMRQWSKRRGIELIHWPDLPRAIEKKLSSYHRTLWIVNFL